MGATIQQPDLPLGTGPEPGEEQQPELSTAFGKTPQDFYSQITKRADVRAILEALAITQRVTGPDATNPVP